MYNFKDWTKQREILIDNAFNIYNHAKDVPGPFRVLYQDTSIEYIDSNVSKMAYWVKGGDISGPMYRTGRSKHFGNSWIDLFPINWERTGIYYMIENNIIKRKSSRDNQIIDQTEILDLLINILKQLYQFNKRYDTTFYNGDIVNLSKFANKWDLEILEIDLK